MDPAGKADRFLNYVLTNQLFKSQELWISRRSRQTPHMGDLATRNIQRGRDHGIRFGFKSGMKKLIKDLLYVSVTGTAIGSTTNCLMSQASRFSHA